MATPISQVQNIDCMEYMKTIPDKYFDLAIVDPPYGLRESGAQTGGAGKLKGRLFNNGRIDIWDNKPDKSYFNELLRISKNQIIWGANYYSCMPSTRCFVCWDKCQPWENFSACEYAWTSFIYPSKIFKFDNRISGKIHPTQKPIELYAYLLRTFAKQGDKILDTHLGSGSSRIAAYQMGFDFYACEIDKGYFDSQEERFRRVCLGEYKANNNKVIKQQTLF